MLKVASLVAVLTVLSKILGLARDLVIAHYYGTSIISDAFNLAYLFTGNIFIIFGGIGGPFYSAAVAYIPKLTNKEELKKFLIKNCLNISLVLVAVAAAIYFAKDYLLSFFIDSSKTEYLQLTKLNIDLLLPLVIIAGPIGILFALMNCYKKYIEPSISPAMVNIALIASVMLSGDSNSALALAIGTSIGGLLALALQLPRSLSIFKSENRQLEEQSSVNNNDFHNILYPALFSTFLSQIIVFVDSFFCKNFEAGSWTALVMANRIIQMPLGVLLTALLVPVFPKITELVNAGNKLEVLKVIKKAVGFAIALSIPGIIVAIFFSEELIRIVFERGAFDSRSTVLVSNLFFYFSFYVIPFIMKDSFTRTLYSFGDSKTPMFIMLFTIVIKIVLNYLLVQSFGLNGIAMATVIATSLNATILFFVVRKKLQ